MRPHGKLRPGILAVFLLLALGGTAFGLPISEVSYVEISLGGGIWEYDFTFKNLSDPVEDAGNDLYDIFFTVDSSITLSRCSLPDGWDGIFGPGFAEFYSVAPGTPPDGADIAPGASLGGFVLLSDGKLSPVEYIAQFFNPTGADPLPVPGTATPVSASVPEPATVMLLGSGIGCLYGVRKRRNRSR